MVQAPKLPDCERVLIVEGYSDLLFYAEVLESIGNHRGVFIQHFNGKADLATKLETFLSPQLLAAKQAIGIIIDADSNAQKTSGDMARTLSRLTSTTVSLGEWTKSQPRLGLFVTPDGTAPGEIETLVWKSFSGDPMRSDAVRCVDGFVSCMARAGFRARSPDKAAVSAFLAISNDEDPRLGPGARGKAINLQRPEFAALKNFLSGL